MKNNKNYNKGITLIALIITIIVLLILSAICLNMVLGDSGIIAKAKIAKEKTNNSQELENSHLNDLENKLDEYSNSSRFASNPGKKLLEETIIEQGHTYDLNDSIYNYNTIKLFVAVDLANGSSYTSHTWDNKEILSDTIVLCDSTNPSSSDVSMFAFMIASSTSHYRTPHLYFTKNNQIYFESVRWFRMVKCIRI